ncbi:MAG: hypothetical protein K8S00_09840 [Bacteroidales bacterium]|nr:hypothetical protein [Bacteroidales bacterium]
MFNNYKDIVSYGGGTQSTAMILMSLEGYKGLERPSFGVYADVGAEPEFINKYVDYFIAYVKARYDFDIHRIKHKEGLESHIINKPEVSRNGNFYQSSTPPFYTLSENGKIGMLMRQCTADYKINPLKKLINSKLKKGEVYRMWIGISFDERFRMKISNYKKRINYYPLVDLFIRRSDSLEYIKKLGVKAPQRSSCYFCPFHSDRYWLKEYHPIEFNRACNFEQKVQNNIKTTDKIYLHSKCKPLRETIFNNENQLNMFPELIDECDGECGI